MRRGARLAQRPRHRLRCEEVGMPFCKATAGNLAGCVATSELGPDQRKVCDVGKSRRTDLAFCCPPAGTTAMLAVFQSTQSTKTSIFSVTVDTVRGRRQRKDDIDRMMKIESLFS